MPGGVFSTVEFVIFDLDGTLVDSEPLCNRAFLDLLPELRERASVEALVRRNRGRRLADILSDLEETFGLEFDAAFERRYRKRVAELFASDLRPIEGVPQMLEALDLPKCVASGGPLEKSRLALEVCGLIGHFEGSIYSSYEVGSWKPDPGLYRHAISDAGFRPEQCAVVEDSPVGIEAAGAAGIPAFLYAPERSPADEGPCVVFASMAELPRLLAREDDASRHRAAKDASDRRRSSGDRGRSRPR